MSPQTQYYQPLFQGDIDVEQLKLKGELRDEPVPVALLEPVEEVARRLVPGVPPLAAPLDPVWRPQSRAETDPI